MRLPNVPRIPYWLSIAVLLVGNVLGAAGCQSKPVRPLVFCQGHKGIQHFYPATFTSSTTIVCNDGAVQLEDGSYVDTP